MGAGGMTPNPDFAAQVQAAFPDKSEALVLGCKSGARSAKAVDVLTGLKYTNTANMTGGFGAWLAAGLPVEK
jgi:rhodanese-related sulfurtransferase